MKITGRRPPGDEFPHADVGERLRHARVAAGFRFARDLADASGTNRQVYYQHEAGNRPVTNKSAEIYANLTHVSPGWIMFGDASQTRGHSRIVGTVGADTRVTLYDDEDMAMTKVVPFIDEELEILEVLTDENRPMYDRGDLVYFRPFTGFSPAETHDVYCVVQLSNNEIVIGKVLAQGRSILPMLQDCKGKTQAKVKIKYASPIELVRKGRSVPQRQLEAA